MVQRQLSLRAEKQNLSLTFKDIQYNPDSLQNAVMYGFNVTLVEVNDELAAKSKVTIVQNLERSARRLYKTDLDQQKQFVTKSAGLVQSTSNLIEAIRSADLVIEAIIEKLSAKQALFANIDKVSKSA